MWNSIFSAVSSAVSSAWVWFDGLFDSIPGAWEFIFVVILIYLIVKHVLAPITGTFLAAGRSDMVKKSRQRKEAKSG